MPLSPNVRKHLRTAGDVLYAFAYYALLCFVTWVFFLLAHEKLQELGISNSIWVSAGAWLSVGLICTLWWPLSHSKEMRGHWREAAPALAVTSLTGPFALILGIVI